MWDSSRMAGNPTNLMRKTWVTLPGMPPLPLLVACRHLDHGWLSSALCPSA
jgi:hypothetical protein